MRHSPVLCLAFLFAFCLSATGCLERVEKTSLNPDGSGKREFDLLIVPQPQMAMGANANKQAEAPPAEQLKTMVQAMVDKSTGVDAWKDLKFDVVKDGRFHVSGVAFFKDLSAFMVFINGMNSSAPQSWHKEGDLMVLDCDASAKAKPQPKEPLPTTDAEIDAKIQKGKLQWLQTKPMLAAMLEKMRDDSTYVLPGKVTDSGLFETSGESSVRRVIEGRKVLEAMDKIANDEAVMRESYKKGAELMGAGPANDAVTKALFGKAGKHIVKVAGPLKPTFDYAKEADAAKTAMPAMWTALGLTAPGAKPAATATTQPSAPAAK